MYKIYEIIILCYNLLFSSSTDREFTKCTAQVWGVLKDLKNDSENMNVLRYNAQAIYIFFSQQKWCGILQNANMMSQYIYLYLSLCLLYIFLWYLILKAPVLIFESNQNLITISSFNIVFFMNTANKHFHKDALNVSHLQVGCNILFSPYCPFSFWAPTWVIDMITQIHNTKNCNNIY